jgi:hypothetical protein
VTLAAVPVLLGSPQPRLFTPSLRPLTPATSRGFQVIAHARLRTGTDLLPFQRTALIRGLETLPDGRYRFSVVLVLVSRQSGKTAIGEALSLWKMDTENKAMVLGTSVAQELAREPFYRVADHAENLGIVARLTRGSIDTSLWLTNGSRYKVGSASRRGGRSLSVDLLLVDELREHVDSWDAWNALTGATTARGNAQTWAFSNMGDERSVVLNGLRAAALSGEDTSICLLEWSAPEGCELDDLDALVAANPGLGHVIRLETLVNKRNTMPPAGYRTEHLCQHVTTLAPAIDSAAWAECADPVPFSEVIKARVVVCLDVAPDLQHVSLVAAALLDDGRVRVEPVAAWETTAQARRELPDWIARVNPRAVGWFPSGPAAALAVDLRKIRGNVELSAADIPAVCQGLAEFVEARRLVHSDDPMLTAQAIGAAKTVAGDGWRFTRKGVGHCDAVYAAAGAIHIARSNLAKGKPRILMPTG